MKILLVDDDPRLRDLVGLSLERAGYQVLNVADGNQALVSILRDSPDLIVLDVGLPEMDGFEVCRRIRAHSEIPIVFLTARDDEIDRVIGLELGADDYVVKPFSPRELVARIKAILKRSRPTPGFNILRHGLLELDCLAHVCRLKGVSIALTATEFRVLEHLLQNPQNIRTRSQLIEAVWGRHSQVSDRTLDSHMRNLRQKLAENGDPNAIETVHGVGIRMKEVI
ncbi:response regulator transcription factor [Cochlodiniinecator piscidefendens]|uniref:response regulator transcription factor n=1 Tax=Cochlodiniinecator piscidefendens TaxID=2715756 RepID=UPI00140A3966|nr:response regulator transcription factor [Cochlodiniinecator piscidefendens]